MRLGITIPLDGFQNRHFVELVQQAEKLGFADAWSYETLNGDAFTPVAAAAAVTERIRLGTAIVPVFTRPAALIALSAATVQQFSGGRFVLGVGISTPTIVEQWMGVPYELPLTRLRETVAALRQTFTGQKVTTSGKAVKNTDSLDIACRILVAVDGEQDLVRENLRRELTAYLTVPQYNRFFQWIGYSDEARAALEAWNAGDRRKALSLVPDYMLESIFVSGIPERIVGRLRDYEQAGITTTALQFTSFHSD